MKHRIDSCSATCVLCVKLSKRRRTLESLLAHLHALPRENGHLGFLNTVLQVVLAPETIKKNYRPVFFCCFAHHRDDRPRSIPPAQENITPVCPRLLGLFLSAWSSVSHSARQFSGFIIGKYVHVSLLYIFEIYLHAKQYGRLCHEPCIQQESLLGQEEPHHAYNERDTVPESCTLEVNGINKTTWPISMYYYTAVVPTST